MVVAILYHTPQFDLPEVRELFKPIGLSKLDRGTLVWRHILGSQLPEKYRETFDGGLDQVGGFTPALFHSIKKDNVNGETAVLTTILGELVNCSPALHFSPAYELTNYDRLANIAKSHEDYPIMLYSK
jgi:hypothetical protein